MKTMTKMLFYACGMLAVFAIAVSATVYADQTEGKEAKAQTTCPITGEPINKDLHVDANGKRIYVCCPGCVAAVRRQPQKYIDQLEAKGVTLSEAPVETEKKGEAAEGKPQTTCPIMGGPINKKRYVDHDGKRIYVCCAGCIAEVKKDPARVIKKMEAEGVTLADVPAETKEGEAKQSEDGPNMTPKGKGEGHGHKHRHGKGHSEAPMMPGTVMAATGGCMGGVCAPPKAE